MGKMGIAMALNIKNNYHEVIGYDISPLECNKANEEEILCYNNFDLFLEQLPAQKIILITLTSDNSVDKSLKELTVSLKPNDIIVHVKKSKDIDTFRRTEMFKSLNIEFFNIDINGGEGLANDFNTINAQNQSILKILMPMLKCTNTQKEDETTHMNAFGQLHNHKPSHYIKKILQARVYDIAEETPLDRASLLQDRLDNQVFLKREDLQSVFSFKIRGAYNKIASLTPEQAQQGIIAASAGNHAQGVAMSASHKGICATIVMPVTTPDIKVNAVRRLGGKAVLFGDTFDEAYSHACILAKEQNLTFIHPYDDPDVIAGQGTIAMEILRQHTEAIHSIFVPVGGGGLIAGIASYIKYLRPETKIIGVEPINAAALHSSLKEGKRIRLDKVDIFADGVAVKQIGEEPWRLAKDLVDEVVLVSTDEICAAVKDIFNDTRSIAEPAGALSVAGLKRYVEQNNLKGQNLIAIVSGANVNFDRLRHISERAELGEERECIISVRLPEKPGSLKKFCLDLGPTAITEFNYRYVNTEDAYVFIGIGNLSGKAERFKTIKNLCEAGYSISDLTDNELAKLHIRHMVGGHILHEINELLYRFHFPERSGALTRFLSCMADTWNISLFHYRNDGATYGQVLVGFEIPPKEQARFCKFLDEVGYEYVDETNNPAYNIFLGNSSKIVFSCP